MEDVNDEVIQKQPQAKDDAVIQKNGAVSQNNNQVALVAEGDNQSALNSPFPSGKPLNPAAQKFNPITIGTGGSHKGNKGSAGTKGKENIAANKEATTQWVQQTFAENLVATNTSCQEVPFQESLEPNMFNKEPGKLHIGEVKVWTEQIEEDSEEGEFLGNEDCSEDLNKAEDDQDGEEEQRVNGQGLQAVIHHNENPQLTKA